MAFEKLPEIIEGLETVNDWFHFGPKSRKAVAWSYFQYGCFSMVALPICLPIGQQAMLCQVPSHSYLEAIGASANYVASVSSAVVMSGNVVISTGDKNVALTGVQAQTYAGEVRPRKG